MKKYVNPRTIRWHKQQLRKSWEAGKILDRRGRVRTPKKAQP